jgi:predicted PP-loop superfamily ATPase
MRCYICDNDLSENEIQQAPDGKWEPCGTCMTVIMDTAYQGEFERPDDNEPEEIEDEE